MVQDQQSVSDFRLCLGNGFGNRTSARFWRTDRVFDKIGEVSWILFLGKQALFRPWDSEYETCAWFRFHENEVMRSLNLLRDPHWKSSHSHTGFSSILLLCLSNSSKSWWLLGSAVVSSVTKSTKYSGKGSDRSTMSKYESSQTACAVSFYGICYGSDVILHAWEKTSWWRWRRRSRHFMEFTDSGGSFLIPEWFFSYITFP